jgi:hypothetical protein
LVTRFQRDLYLKTLTIEKIMLPQANRSFHTTIDLSLKAVTCDLQESGVYVVKLIHLHAENTSLHYHAASKEEPSLLHKLMEGSAFDKEIYY